MAGVGSRNAVCITPSHKTAARCVLLIGALLFSVLGSGVGRAQQAAPIDPRQIEKNIDTLQLEQGRRKRPNLRLPQVARPEGAADTKPFLKLKRISVQGATAIPDEALRETYRPYLGRVVSRADLAAITDDMTRLYREAGYQLSRAIVPPQKIKGGAIMIQVVEGQVARIEVNGGGDDPFGIKPIVAVIKDEAPSRLGTIERQLQLVNDIPGVRIADIVLEEIGSATGRFRLVVNVEAWRVYAAQSVDNFGSSAVGPWQAYSITSLNSYLKSGDTLGVTLSAVPDHIHELRYGRLSYDVPIGIDGARIGASTSYSQVWPSDQRRLIDTRDQTESTEVRASIAPLLTRTSQLRLTATGTFTDASERTSFGTSYSDHVRMVGLSADFKLQDNLDGLNYMTLGWRKGLDVLGASRLGDDLNSRSDASGTFSAFNYAFTRFQKLSDAWSLKLSANGQWTSDALLLSQQFFLGASAFGPGYYNRDNGVTGLAELRFEQMLDHAFFKGYQLYGFVDGGRVWDFRGIHDNVATLSSAGFGVRLNLADQLQAAVSFAAPIHHSPVGTVVHDYRILFSISNFIKLCPERAEMRCS